MDADAAQVISERDQLWTSLWTLRGEIEQLARGALDGSERQNQLIQVLARIVTAELEFRSCAETLS